MEEVQDAAKAVNGWTYISELTEIRKRLYVINANRNVSFADIDERTYEIIYHQLKTLRALTAIPALYGTPLIEQQFAKDVNHYATALMSALLKTTED